MFKLFMRIQTVSDLFGDLVNGEEVFLIQDAVSKGITKASLQK